MKQIHLFVCLFLISIFSLSSTRKDRSPELVKGKIIDSRSQSPIEKAYIYIISGEEEALSSKDGSFEITTWQAFPVTIKVHHDEYQTSTVVYKNGGDKPVIKLQKK